MRLLQQTAKPFRPIDIFFRVSYAVASMSTALDKLNAKIFSEQLRTSFKLNGSFNPPIQLELEEIKEGDSSPKIELFSLFFRGPASPHLPQQIYSLEHDKLGAFEIFLTAIASDAKGILYESVFHRFRPIAAS